MSKYANITTYQAAFATRAEAETLAGQLREQGHKATVLDSHKYTDERIGHRWVVVDERNGG